MRNGPSDVRRHREGVDDPGSEQRDAFPQPSASRPERLTAQDRRVLDFERQWWRYAGAKEREIRERFDMTSTRYYQILTALIDSPAALRAEPLLVHRLRRRRDARQQQRAARR